mmetsp:Transcript_11486/g.42887  ORF Transcript_11486/g.42887 Transcript_11486/m.42887 type:complete len:218 (+) Transcript_11486:350-1003(+)
MAKAPSPDSCDIGSCAPQVRRRMTLGPPSCPASAGPAPSGGRRQAPPDLASCERGRRTPGHRPAHPAQVRGSSPAFRPPPLLAICRTPLQTCPGSSERYRFSCFVRACEAPSAAFGCPGPRPWRGTSLGSPSLPQEARNSHRPSAKHSLPRPSAALQSLVSRDRCSQTTPPSAEEHAIAFLGSFAAAGVPFGAGPSICARLAGPARSDPALSGAAWD